jgi:alpha-L-fucosidase
MIKITGAFAFTLVAFVLFSSRLGAQEKYQPTWESLSKYQTAEWFRDAKFGIFIHWGVYPRNMYQVGSPEYKHHIATYGPQSKFGYKDFIPMFKAEKFDPHAWVTLFKKAGAKYVVPVAEHHDGFAMYKTALSKWNAYDMGPHRDVIGELAAEIKKQGLIFGLSSHRIEHWWFFNGGKSFDSDVLDPKYNAYYGPAHNEDETMSPEFMNDWLMRDIELVNNYQPQLVWFDWWIEQPALTPYRKSFASYYYNKGLEWNKEVVINYKHDSYPDGTAVLDLERGKLDAIRDQPWQTDDAIGNQSWGYTTTNTFKDARYVVTNLIDIVSKNGNLLLNIGPKADGTITDEETQTLLGTGKWLDVNGEAIYATRPWKIYGEGPTKSASGSFADQKVPFGAHDIRFTTKHDTLFVIAMGLPTENTLIKALSIKSGNGKIATIKMLGSDQNITWKQKEDELIIEPSKQYPSEYAVSYAVTFAKP